MKLSFSKHAQAKIAERRITEEMVTNALQDPEAKFYDTGSRAQVAIREVSQQGLRLSLVVVFRRTNHVYHIVTAYPLKDARDEAEKKVKIGRWIPI